MLVLGHGSVHDIKVLTSTQAPTVFHSPLKQSAKVNKAAAAIPLPIVTIVFI